MTAEPTNLATAALRLAQRPEHAAETARLADVVRAACDQADAGRELDAALADFEHVQQRRSATDCPTCERIGEGFGPWHDASPNCLSGNRPHCTCDTCF